MNGGGEEKCSRTEPSVNYFVIPLSAQVGSDECVEEQKKAGQRGSRKLLPALQRAPHVAPDSSDEEAERLELLGQQGR